METIAICPYCGKQMIIKLEETPLTIDEEIKAINSYIEVKTKEANP